MRNLVVSVSALVALFTSIRSYSQTLETFKLPVDSYTTLRVGVFAPEKPVADVIFLHGFSDRLDNHMPLFNELTSRGMRVISFEYPSHGETQSASLGWYSFEDLFNLVRIVEAQTVEEDGRPLFLMGWSTGGLLAARMAQKEFFSKFTRAPSGLVLIAPGVSVYLVPGQWGFVTEESLTSNPSVPHKGPIAPSSPFAKPVFSLRLLANSLFSWTAMPRGLPVLTLIGGDLTDVYADSKEVKRWVRQRRKGNPLMYGVQCAQGKHELDNEFEPLGVTVRRASSDFLSGILSGNLRDLKFELPPDSTCSIF